MHARIRQSQRRRSILALGIVLAVLLAFVVRLVDIQVVRADELVSDSRQVAFNATSQVHGTRGEIVDDSGNVLAGSALLYDAIIDPMRAGKVKTLDKDGNTVVTPWPEVLASITEVTGQDPAEVQAIVDDAKAINPEDQYEYLLKGMSTEKYRQLAAKQIPFLSFEPRPTRIYPDGAVSGNLVGFTGSDGAPLAGIEIVQNECLAATDGVVKYERGKTGVVLPGSEFVEKESVDGGTVRLTIDQDLQWYMSQLAAEQSAKLGAKAATISVMEVKTGKIKAMAEYPSVDPNDIDATSPDNWYSDIFTNQFEPGSTFKPLTAAALIDGAGQTPLSTVVTSGYETFEDGARVSDAFPHPTYTYTLAGVLIDSSNAGISRLSERIDPALRFDYLKKLGISTGSNIEFPGETQGILRPAEEWDAQTKYNTAYGQGLTTTVPELLGAYGAIANDGTRLPLQLVESCTTADGAVSTPKKPDPVQAVSKDTAEQVQMLMENVAMQAAYGPMIEIPGYRIGVKSGTAEQVDPGTGRYKAGVYFTTMIGMAPADDPQYVVAVTFDEPTAIRSSTANAEMFKKAMTQVLKTYRVMPSTTPPTELPRFG